MGWVTPAVPRALAPATDGVLATAVVPVMLAVALALAVRVTEVALASVAPVTEGVLATAVGLVLVVLVMELVPATAVVPALAVRVTEVVLATAVGLVSVVPVMEPVLATAVVPVMLPAKALAVVPGSRVYRVPATPSVPATPLPVMPLSQATSPLPETPLYHRLPVSRPPVMMLVTASPVVRRGSEHTTPGSSVVFVTRNVAA